MLNKEQFAKEIVEIAIKGDNIAYDKDNNRVDSCSRLGCSNCYFSENGHYCDINREKWANSKYVEPITKEEIGVLRKLYDLGFRYICKDDNREITVYDELPDKMLKEGFWYKTGIKMLAIENIPICANMKFSNIQWEDEEPTEIAKVIGEKNENKV